MQNLLRYAVQQKKQTLINELIKSGIYEKNNNHLYEWTLNDLEKEYQYITNDLGSNFKLDGEN